MCDHVLKKYFHNNQVTACNNRFLEANKLTKLPPLCVLLDSVSSISWDPIMVGEARGPQKSQYAQCFGDCNAYSMSRFLLISATMLLLLVLVEVISGENS